jgi:multidrug efflux pump subunit AcrA (membrane-fusion protein)
MRKIIYVLGAAGFVLVAVTAASFAQQPQTVRVRGTVEAVDGQMLSVKARDGAMLKV